MPDTTIDSEVEEILENASTWCWCGSKDCQKALNYKEAAQAITNLIAQEANKAAVAELEALHDYFYDKSYKDDKISGRIARLIADKEKA